MGVILNFVTYYILAVVSIIIVLNLIQMIQKQYSKKEVHKLEKEKNIIIDAPIMTELSKVESLIKNEKLKIKYKEWQDKIEKIKNNMLNDINDLILEADFLIDKKDFNSFRLKKIKIELKIYEAYENKNKLFEEIREITLCEDKSRSEVTLLKSRYREILKNFDSLENDLGEFKEVVQIQIENIEKRFQDFETLLENQEYDEVNIIVKSLDALISHLETVIDELPSAVLMAQNIIPKRIDEINLNYKKLSSDGYQLDYLNLEYNVNEIERKITEILSKLRVLNLEDVLFELKTIIEYFDSIFNDFEREKMAKKSFDEQVITFKTKSNKIRNLMSKLYGKVADAKYNYTLTNDQISVLDNLSLELENADSDFDVLYETKKAVSFPYTRLIKELEILIIRLSKIEEKIDNYMETVGNMQDDEKRAREQLGEIKEILKTSKYRIREYKLPVIPNNYFVELKEAHEGIREINKELDKKPINIEILNTRVDTARDLVFKFSNTTNELIKTTIMAENAIVYGNRYKSNKEYIEEGLEKAEMLFLKGEYKKALELTLNTIDIIEPGIHKKLLGLYEKN